MKYKQDSGEKVYENSCAMRQLWNTNEGYYHHGTIKETAKLKSSGIKRLVEDVLWTQGLIKKLCLVEKKLISVFTSTVDVSVAIRNGP